MAIWTALAVVAIWATASMLPADYETAAWPARAGVLAAMAPAPGRWELEDAPAYFSDRAAFAAEAAPAPVTAPVDASGGPIARWLVPPAMPAGPEMPLAHRRP